MSESRVLAIYTGGTLGMLNTPQGYVPEKGYLTVSYYTLVTYH